MKETMCRGIVIGFLMDILNKVLQYKSEEECQSIIFNNMLTNDSKVTIRSIIQNNPNVIMIALYIAFLSIIVIIVISFRMKISNQKYLIKMALIEEERYRIATEISNDILFEYDILSDTMSNADKYVEVFGRNQKIHHFTEFMDEKQNIHEEDRGVFEEYCQALHYGKQMIEVEYRILDSTQDYVWCHIRGKTIYNSKNLPIKVIGKLVNIDIQKKELEKLLFKAQRDPLTNVYNKVVTKENIDERIQISRIHEKHALLLIDIDNFKRINDEYGHLFGDKVLTSVISHVKSMFRDQDLVGRIGGDEFVVFMSDITSREQIIMKANLLREAFRNTYRHDDEEIVVSGSIGIAMYPMHGMTYDTLMEKADIALYQVKNQGKNNYAIFGTE